MADTIGARIRQLRVERRMSQAELAKLAGMTRQMLYMIESGRTADPGALKITALAEQLGVSTDVILRGVPAPKKRWVLIDEDEQVSSELLAADAALVGA